MTLMMPLTNRDTSASIQLATFACDLQWHDIPETLQEIVLDHVVDTVGCCVASVGGTSWRALASAIAADRGLGRSSAVGMAGLVTPPQAALLNGLLARSAEFDDMAMPDLHPGGVLVPAAFASAEAAGTPGSELLAALTAGFEVLLRVGRAAYDGDARNSRFLDRGLDATALCGTVAASAVAARLAGLDRHRTAHAIGIAVSLASGSLEANRSGGTVKQFQSGWAARSGLEAAALAAQGVTGPVMAFEGRYGFYECFAGGEFDPEILTGELGRRWASDSLRLKPYPCNYYTHSGIDAVLALGRRGVEPHPVSRIVQRVATPMLRTMGDPLAAKQHPATGYDAKFSGPFTIASTLLGGGGLGLGLDDFSDEVVTSPARVELMSKISVESDARCDAIFPDHAPCVLELETSDGRMWREEVWVNRGSAENTLSSDEIGAKFHDNVRPAMRADDAQALYSALRGLPRALELSHITERLRIATPRNENT
jgi:2-methylcitrate dehydratase PrpD